MRTRIIFKMGLAVLVAGILLVASFILMPVSTQNANAAIGNGSGSFNDPTVAEAKAYVNSLAEVKNGTYSVVDYKTVFINGKDGAKELQVLLKANSLSTKDKKLKTSTINASNIGKAYSFSVSEDSSSSVMKGGTFKVGGGGEITTDYFSYEFAITWSQEIKRTNTTGNGCEVEYTIPNVTKAHLGKYSLIQRSSGHEYMLLMFRAEEVTRTEIVKDNSGKENGEKKVHDHYKFGYYNTDKFYSIESQYFTWSKIV